MAKDPYIYSTIWHKIKKEYSAYQKHLLTKMAPNINSTLQK